jgi:predicted dehydrogenase
MKACLEKGKDAFVEWPLGANLQQATALAELAKKYGSKTVVGLQARKDPHIQKVRQLVKDGAIGELLSSTINVAVGFMGDTEPPGVSYLSKKEVGGNLLTILLGHNIDWVTYALGELEDFSALLATRWPTTKLLHADGSFDRMIERETPDHIMLQGTLAESGASVSFALRGGKIFKDSKALTWRIFGTKGEIRVTSLNPLLGSPTGTVELELYDHQKEDVEIVEVFFPESVKDIAPLAKDIGLLYEAFVAGDVDGMATFEDAVKLHQIIDDMEKSSEQKTSRSKLK